MSFVGYCCAREAVGNAEAVAAEIEPCRNRRRFIFSSSSRPAGALDPISAFPARVTRSGNWISPLGTNQIGQAAVVMSGVEGQADGGRASTDVSPVDPKETSGQRLLKFDRHLGFLRFGWGRYRPGKKTP